LLSPGTGAFRCEPSSDLIFWNLAYSSISAKLSSMTTVKEIEAAISKLSRTEVEELRQWIEDYLEDQLELTDEVKAKLDQSRAEITTGQYIKEVVADYLKRI
jgi:hypothetical protein